MLAPAVNTTRRVPLYSPFSPALQGALDFHLGTAEPRPRSPKKPTAPRRPVAHAFRLFKFLSPACDVSNRVNTLQSGVGAAAGSDGPRSRRLHRRGVTRAAAAARRDPAGAVGHASALQRGVTGGGCRWLDSQREGVCERQVIDPAATSRRRLYPAPVHLAPPAPPLQHHHVAFPACLPSSMDGRDTATTSHEASPSLLECIYK